MVAIHFQPQESLIVSLLQLYPPPRGHKPREDCVLMQHTIPYQIFGFLTT